MNTSKILFSLFLVLSLLVSCEKDNNHSEDDELATRMNQFIQSNLSTFYLWYDEIPNIKPESKKDPKEYFKVLLSSKDKWSLITDDANGLLEEMAGTGETYGYGLAYGRFKDSDKCFAIPKWRVPGLVSLLRSLSVKLCEFNSTIMSPRFSFSAAGEPG